MRSPGASRDRIGLLATSEQARSKRRSEGCQAASLEMAQLNGLEIRAQAGASKDAEDVRIDGRVIAIPPLLLAVSHPASKPGSASDVRSFRVLDHYRSHRRYVCGRTNGGPDRAYGLLLLRAGWRNGRRGASALSAYANEA